MAKIALRSDKERYLIMSWRWSLFTAIVIGLFWLLWYRSGNPVPVATKFGLWLDVVPNLPFVVSRWWDIIAGPIYSIIVILLVWYGNQPSSAAPDSSECYNWQAAVAWAIGMVLGVIAAAVFTLSGLYYGMAVAAILVVLVIPATAILIGILWLIFWTTTLAVRPFISLGRWLAVEPKPTS